MQDILTIQEVGDKLHIPKASIYQMVHKKTIPFFKIGQRLRFNTADIEEWLEKKRGMGR